MLGWKLFVRALNLLIENLGAALRVSALPYLVLAGLSAWLTSAYPTVTMTGLATPDQPLPTDPSQTTLDPEVVAQMAEGSMWMLLLALVNVFFVLWVAVAWHRYVLLGEEPRGVVPPLHGRATVGYLGRSILVGILAVLTAAAVGTMAAVLVLPIIGASGYAIVYAVMLFVAMLVFYRLALVLPATAIDTPMTLQDSLLATRGHSGTVVVLALVTTAFTLALQVPTILDGGGMGPVTFLYQTVVQWIGLMLGVGTLTALYGHLVEGRPVE
ncbi:hypothetical protein [Jannaschia sp. LMIT008]|uniref:hypothetical protein n=1 Tax=Jannaschia maritima TaxID=3032585 RepID=UPI002810CE71|nr:hypothetical protein [Jannaschia sp. LMIT008]